MFADACARYAALLCNVGGGSDTEPGVRIGSGCLLSPRHVLTALSVIRPLPAKLSWPVVEKYDGVFRCAVTFEDAAEDIAILTATDQITPDEGEAPTAFPLLPTAAARMGSSVGYITWLKVPKAARRVWAFHFTPSAVSTVLPADGSVGPRYVLGGEIAERGASGTAVFTPGGELAGVIVRTLPVPPEPGDKLPRTSFRPVMAGADRVAAALRELVGASAADPVKPDVAFP